MRTNSRTPIFSMPIKPTFETKVHNSKFIHISTCELHTNISWKLSAVHKLIYPYIMETHLPKFAIRLNGCNLDILLNY